MAEIIIPSSSSSIIPSVDPNQVTEVNLPFHIIKLLDESHPIIHKEPIHWQFGVNPDPKRMHDVMLENMVYHRGLGLSANQIGMPVKVFAMRVDDSDNAIVCFNPKITKESDLDSFASLQPEDKTYIMHMKKLKSLIWTYQ